jgi:thioredoxin
MSSTTTLDRHTFDERLASTAGILLVDFTAEWCPPCRALSPVLEQLHAEAEGVTVVSVDVDTEPELAARFGVMSFPTMLFFIAGEPVHRLVGARGLGSLREELVRVRSLTESGAGTGG